MCTHMHTNIHIYTKRKREFKELAYVIVEAWEVRICRAGQSKAKDQRRVVVEVQRSSAVTVPSCSGEVNLFSTD